MDRAYRGILKWREPPRFRICGAWTSLVLAPLLLAGCAATGPGSRGQAGGLAKAEAAGDALVSQTLVQQGHNGLEYRVLANDQPSCLVFAWANVGEVDSRAIEPDKATPAIHVVLRTPEEKVAGCLEVERDQALELVVRDNRAESGWPQDVARFALEVRAYGPDELVAIPAEGSFYRGDMNQLGASDALLSGKRCLPRSPCYCIELKEESTVGFMAKCGHGRDAVEVTDWMCPVAQTYEGRSIDCPLSETE